jgi:hypothetical protein
MNIVDLRKFRAGSNARIAATIGTVRLKFEVSGTRVESLVARRAQLR